MRKSFSERRKKRRERGGGQRGWKLKALDMEVDDSAAAQRKGAEAQAEEDRERFYEVRRMSGVMAQSKAAALVCAARRRCSAGGGRPERFYELTRATTSINTDYSYF